MEDRVSWLVFLIACSLLVIVIVVFAAVATAVATILGCVNMLHYYDTQYCCCSI